MIAPINDAALQAGDVSAIGLCHVVAWPLAARAQKADRVRRIGVLIPYAGSDAEGQSRAAALQQGLEKRDGRSVAMFGSTIVGASTMSKGHRPPSRNYWRCRQT